MKTFLLSLLMVSSAWGSPQKGNRWDQLMGLIHQEMTILESTRKKGPDLQYRLLELHSEKLKLIHEKNNKEFMQKSTAQGGAKNKEAHFAETRAYYDKTKEFGIKLLKDFPKTARRPEVLFALALNSRDYAKDNITEKYLLQTISLIYDPHHSLRHHAETALADFYYNEKRFQDAISYYHRVIKKTEDEWLTKHLFNLSWCYLKVREFDKAIATIKEAYFLSKNKSYVNIKDQVLENVGSFHVYAGRPLEGLDFYLQNESDPITYLIGMAQKTADKGHEKETETILAAAQKIINKKDLYQYQEEVHHAHLDFYRHYNRFYDHEKTSRVLTAYYKMAEAKPEAKLKTEMKDDAIEKMRSLAGFLQVKLAKDMKKDEGQYKDEELSLVLNFFDHLIYLDSSKKVEYFYFRAETYYSVRRFKEAASSYRETVNEAKLTKNEEHARKSLNSLLALTGQEELPKEENKDYLVFAYTEHLEFWPKDEKSEQIYPKLFEIYRDGHDDVKATLVLKKFNQQYPEHLKQQQSLMTKVLDQFIEKQETVKLAHTIQDFKQGFLSFDKETIEKTEMVLGNILFLQYQNMAKKGDKLAAAKGFESIYVNKLYTDKVKYQSAFFAALTYLELGETLKSFYWQELAHARMTQEEKLSRREEQLKITERTYRLQDFDTAHKLSSFLLKEFCFKKDQVQQRFYEIAIMTTLVEGNPVRAEEIVTKYSHCHDKQEARHLALAQIYQHYEKQANFFGLRDLVKKHSNEDFQTQYRFTLQKWYWEKSDLDLRTRIQEELKSLNHPESVKWLEEMKHFEKAQLEREELFSVVVWNAPVFKGDEFNRALEGYLLKVQAYKSRHESLMQSTQLDLAILSTRHFSQMYKHVGETIVSQRPMGMDEATLKDFQGAMRQLAAQFKTAHTQYEKQLSKAIQGKDTMTWGSRSIASIEQVENPVFSFFTGVTMDKVKE